MENPLISVIIPVYNGEKFIDRVMSSLVDQSPNQIEIILVNDGSTDNSGKICTKYEFMYSNVKVVDKENGGISTARNAGLQVSSGSYISFVDVDDTVESNTYEKIIKAIDSYNPDIIDFGYNYISRYGQTVTCINRLKKNTILSRDYIVDYILPPLLNLRRDENNFIFDFVWNKIYKKEIIKNNNIIFNETRRTWEDRIFVVRYLKYVSSYLSLNEIFYNYMDVPNSLSRRYDLNFFDIIIESYLYYFNDFSDIYNFNTDYVNSYWCQSIEKMIYYSLKEKSNKKEIENIIKKTLSNDIVINWYKKRISKSNFDYKVSNYVAIKNVDKALYLYKHKYIFNKLECSIKYFINNVKFKISCFIKRI